MEFKLERNRILILPKNEQDEAYLEDTLGLVKEGDHTLAVRKNVYRLSSFAYVEITGGKKLEEK